MSALAAVLTAVPAKSGLHLQLQPIDGGKLG